MKFINKDRLIGIAVGVVVTIATQKGYSAFKNRQVKPAGQP